MKMRECGWKSLIFSTGFLFIFLLCFTAVSSQTTVSVEESDLDLAKPTGKSSDDSTNESVSINQKLNSTDEVKVEVKPKFISREQWLRFRKFLSRKGFVFKNSDFSPEAIQIGDESIIEYDPDEADTNVNFVDGKNSIKHLESLSEVYAEDILPLLPRNLTTFYPLIDELKNEKCHRHAKYFLQGLHNLTKWAVQMFDASTKIPEGILYGSSYNLGNFDECVNVAVKVPGESLQEELLKGQYCLAKVYLSQMRNGGKNGKKELQYPSHSAWGTLKVPTTRREFRKDITYWTFCIPSGCTNEDVEVFLNSIVNMLNIKGLELKFEVSSDMCQVKRDVELDGYDIALGFVVAFFILVIAIATAYDLFVVRRKPNEHKSLKTTILVCFSGYTNFLKLSAYTPSAHNLDSIFGIKAITMILILMGHASAFIIGGPSMNSNFKEEAVLKVENGILLNNPLLVDTFLMIGAFLFCRLLLAELEKRKFINPLMVYVARIIRLTPAYAIIIAIYCTWLYKIDSGPLWESKIGLERERCRTSWWANLLYINNYVGNDKLCMFQSWYLAVDTQFFFLAPGIIYPLNKWPVLGEILLFGVTIISIVIPFVITFINNLDPVLMMYASEITDLSANPMYKSTYIKTHMRGMSYTIGLFLGYVIHKMQSSGYKVPKKILWFGWVVGIFFAISSMFTVSVFYYRPYDAFESACYAALHRVGWCIGIAWIMFACITNNAGFLNKFLSQKVWVPLSRLSYCAYLVNGLVELHTIGTLRHTRYLTNLEVAKETVSHIMLTYGLAIVFSVLFEAPILSIESLLLKKSNNSHAKKPMDSSTVSVESQSSTETTTYNSST